MTSTMASINHVFLRVTEDDVKASLDAVAYVEENIIGRVCGNIADKVSQYLAVIDFCRETNAKELNALEIGVLFGGACILKLMAS